MVFDTLFIYKNPPSCRCKTAFRRGDERKGERKMQKLCFILFGVIITTTATAANLCVRNDTMVVAMNPMVGGNSYSSTPKAAGGEWTVVFSYGTIRGISGCTSSASGGTGSIAPATIADKISIKNSDACYCQMLSPTKSQWVYTGYNMSTACESCPGKCGDYVQRNLAMRSGLFRSANQLD